MERFLDKMADFGEHVCYKWFFGGTMLGVFVGLLVSLPN